MQTATVNQPQKTDNVTQELRKQCMKRASTIALMIDEAQAAGAQGTDHARRAIYRYGELLGADLRAKLKDPDNLVEFAEYFGSGLEWDIFEMEHVEKSADKLYIDFHYCPYVAYWEKMGYSGEQLDHLCDVTMEGDRAIGDTFPAFQFTLGKTIAQGHPTCQIRFDRKK